MDFFPKIQTQIPGPLSRELSGKLKKYEVPTVTSLSGKGPVFWKKAEGIHVWDVDGNRYLDLTSAFGVASLGHGDSDVMSAIQNQSQKLAHAMGDVHPTDLKAELCQKLSEITFERWSQGKQTGQTLLGNSGFEAVEAALKTARLFTGKRGVIAFEGGYHGLGYGALEATWRSDFRKPFLDQLGHFVEFIPYPRESGNQEENLRQMEEVEKGIQEICLNSEIGAILVEPIQGRGGEVIPPAGFLPMLKHLCVKKRILLIVDEIYTGFWRTGKWFAVEHENVQPDIICLGKALSGSLPISACVGSRDIMAAWPESKGEALHTSTFLGNPLACAAALASIWKFEIGSLHWDIQKKGEKWLKNLSSALKGKSTVQEVRGLGFLLGIEFQLDENRKAPAFAVSEKLLQYGILTLPSGPDSEILSLTPPLIMESEVLEWSAEQIARRVD